MVIEIYKNKLRAHSTITWTHIGEFRQITLGVTLVLKSVTIPSSAC